MVLPTDVSGSVSRALTLVIDLALKKTEGRDVPTLAILRQSIADGIADELLRTGRITQEAAWALPEEVDELIEEYGEEALVTQFIRYRVSEDLATVFQAVIDDPEPYLEPELMRETRDNPQAVEPPSLAVVKRAMQQGDLLTRLLAEGAIDPDDDDTLMEELDTLIELHGGNALAEDFLR